MQRGQVGEFALFFKVDGFAFIIPACGTVILNLDFSTEYFQRYIFLGDKIIVIT